MRKKSFRRFSNWRRKVKALSTSPIVCREYSKSRTATPFSRWRFYIHEGYIADITRRQLIEHIIGGEYDSEFAKFNQPGEEVLLEVNGLCWRSR